MSKRKQVIDGKEYLALVHEFDEAGYLPEAVFNTFTNIGWNFDAERKIFTPEEAIERFSIERVNPNPRRCPMPSSNGSTATISADCRARNCSSG